MECQAFLPKHRNIVSGKFDIYEYKLHNCIIYLKNTLSYANVLIRHEHSGNVMRLTRAYVRSIHSKGPVLGRKKSVFLVRSTKITQ